MQIRPRQNENQRTSLTFTKLKTTILFALNDIQSLPIFAIFLSIVFDI